MKTRKYSSEKHIELALVRLKIENEKLQREIDKLKHKLDIIPDRQHAIDTLRPYVTDEIIGSIFGITRERVAQIGGRRRTTGQVRESPYDEEIEKLALAGYTMADIRIMFAEKGISLSISDVSGTYYRLGITPKERVSKRHAKALADIKHRLNEFLKLGLPFKMGNICKWDYNICVRMQRIVPNPESTENAFKQWADELGVEWEGYTFKVGKDGKRIRQLND